LGYGFVETFVLLEEMGKTLLPSPFFSTVVLGATAILTAGTEEQKKDLLPGIAEGARRIALAMADPSGSGTGLRATAAGDDVTLDGTKTFVVDGASAPLLVVAATDESGAGLFLVDPDQDGVARHPLETLDQTRKQAEIRFTSARARRLGEGDAADPLARTLDVGSVALAGESVGGARRCLEMTTEYVSTRVQFDRPVGSFQALQHRLADVFMEVEMARSAAYYAAWAVAEGSDETPAVAPLAKSYCTEAFFHAASESIQMHGGIGFTWEHDAHLYFKRAKSSEALLGGTDAQRELIATRIGL
jgi:alkylation response protein AidB-like acyl-CoA dehydrogenase